MPTTVKRPRRRSRRLHYCYCGGCPGCCHPRGAVSPDAEKHINDGGSCLIPVAYAGRLCSWCSRGEDPRS